MSNSETRGLLARFLSWPSYYVFLISFLIGGVLLCGSSLVLQIGDLPTPKGAPYSCMQGNDCPARQVGYLWAPNWSLTYAILGPLVLLLMLEALKGVRRVLDHLFQSGMVRDNDKGRVDALRSSAAWFEGTKARSGLLLVCAGVVPALLYSEWCNNNLLRLVAGPNKLYELSDYDWGLAAILPGAHVGIRWPVTENIVFDFLAFSCEVVLVGATVLCFLYLLDVSQVLPDPESRVNGLLFPNLASKDPRRGFQEFEEPLQLMLNASLVVYLISYMIRINRIYMRDSGYSNIWDFVQRDLIELGRNDAIKQEGSSLLSILLKTPAEARYQEFFGGIAVLLVSIFSLVVIILVVRSAAQRAKVNAQRHYESNGAQSLFGLAIEEEKKRVDDMTTWPLEWRYLQLNALIAMMFFAPVVLWFYRIGFYLFLLFTAAVLARLKKVAGQ